MASSSHLPAAASAAASMRSLPSAVVAHLANAFLDDREAVAWAASCRATLDDLRSTYRVRRWVSLSEAINFLPTTVATSPERCARVGVTTLVLVSQEDAEHLARLHELRTVKTVKIDYGSSLHVALPLPLALPPALDKLKIKSSAGGLVLSAFLLPATLRSIRLPNSPFDCTPQGLDRVVWPTSLTSITNIGDDGTDIETWSKLPEGVLKCRFGPRFDQSIPVDFLPPNILDCRFGDSFDQPLSGNIFISPIERLSINNADYSHGLDLSQLPSSCTDLALPASRISHLRLPMHAKKLALDGLGDNSYSDLELPISLSNLTLHPDVSLGTIRWPPELGPLTLRLSQLDLPILEGHLPPSVTELYLDYWRGSRDELVLPEGLLSLHLNFDSTSRIKEFTLPTSLTRLNDRPWPAAYGSLSR